MCTFFVQQGLLKARNDKDALPAKLLDKEKEEILEWTHSAIHSSKRGCMEENSYRIVALVKKLVTKFLIIFFFFFAE